MCNNSKTAGFSLVELIVVMAIIGILFSILTLNFNSMNRKAKIEQIARELVADLNMARSESIFRGKPHSLVINPTATGYIFRRYSSLDEDRSSTAPNPATATTPPYGVIMTKNVSYGLTQGAGTPFTDPIFMFDRNGFTTDLNTIRVNLVDSGAAFDCVVVSASRTNIGRMEGGSCVQK